MRKNENIGNRKGTKCIIPIFIALTDPLSVTAWAYLRIGRSCSRAPLRSDLLCACAKD